MEPMPEASDSEQSHSGSSATRCGLEDVAETMRAFKVGKCGGMAE